jgi:hypothetical protein
MNNNPSPLDFNRKREPGEIIQATFTFLRAEYTNLIRPVALYIIPFMVMFALAQVLLQIRITEAASQIPETEPERLIQELGRFYGNFMIIIFFNVFVQALFAGLVYTYITDYLKKGSTASFESSISEKLFQHSFLAILAAFTVAVLSLTGLMFFILPGVLIANSLSLTVFVAVYEKGGTLQAISRSWALVRQNWWGNLFLNVIGILFIWLASIAVSLPVHIHDTVNGVVPANLETTPQWRWWFSGAAILVSSLASIFPMVFMAFQYFNLSVREEESQNR